MPRVDPITGCAVMTRNEVIAMEAEREGVTTEKLLADIYADEEMDRLDTENAMRQPAEALRILKAACANELSAWEENEERGEELGWKETVFRMIPDPNINPSETDMLIPCIPAEVEEDMERYPRPPQPKEILDVMDAKYSCSARDEHDMILAKATCDDGKEHVFRYSTWSSSGSFYEPPDFDDKLETDPDL